jgi:glycerol-3-phosphate cytidylyltransferase
MIGITAGSWDLLHAGHILFLKECRRNCSELVVGLLVDPSIERSNKNKPVQSIYERVLQLKACKYVDDVVVYESERELETILTNGHFDIRFMGTDHEGGKITAENAVPIEFIPRTHNYSSTELVERIKNGRTKNTR